MAISLGESTLAADRVRSLGQSALIKGRQFATQGRTFGPRTAQAFGEGIIRAEAETDANNVYRYKSLEQQEDQFNKTFLENQRQFDKNLKQTRDLFKIEQENAMDRFNRELAFQKEKYDNDSGFFSKLVSFCFITTAVCESLGKGDDCDELNTLRKYRDTWLKDNHPESIEEYYKIAPGIVEVINERPDSDKIWHGIYNDYIDPCIEYVNSGRNELAYTEYKCMVESLTDKYIDKEVSVNG